MTPEAQSSHHPPAGARDLLPSLASLGRSLPPSVNRRMRRPNPGEALASLLSLSDGAERRASWRQAITALGQSDDRLSAAGFDLYLRKPLEPARIAEILDRISL